MIPPEWSERLDEMSRAVDIELHILHRRLSGEEKTDWILWAKELKDADIEKWEELW
jgi:hypothetical protein